MSSTCRSQESCTFSLETLPFLRDHLIDGTPFVPLAWLVEELIAAAPPEDPDDRFVGIGMVRIEQPLMLRRNRPKEVRCELEGSQVRLLSGSPASICIRGTYGHYGTRGTPGTRGPGPIADDPPGGTPPRDPSPGRAPADAQAGERFEDPSLRDGESRALPGARPATRLRGPPADPFRLPRERLYPHLFFHGPTFQGDAAIALLRPGRLFMQFSGLAPEPEAGGRLEPAARNAVIPADLGLQAAALFLAWKAASQQASPGRPAAGFPSAASVTDARMWPPRRDGAVLADTGASASSRSAEEAGAGGASASGPGAGFPPHEGEARTHGDSPSARTALNTAGCVFPMVPRGCREYSRRRQMPVVRSVRIEVTEEGPGICSVDVHDSGGGFLLTWQGLQLEPMRTPFPEAGLRLLDDLRAAFPL